MGSVSPGRHQAAGTRVSLPHFDGWCCGKPVFFFEYDHFWLPHPPLQVNFPPFNDRRAGALNSTQFLLSLTSGFASSSLLYPPFSPCRTLPVFVRRLSCAMFSLDWRGLILPIAYILVLGGTFITFSSVYRKRKAGKCL